MTVYEQLKDFCDCLPEMEDDVFERNVDELIHLISILTCWEQSTCETFLNSERVEYTCMGEIDPCACYGGVVSFVPYYRPFQADTFRVDLIEIRGIEETETPITDFAYIEALGELRIDLSGHVTNAECGCGPERRLRVQYDAGYSQLPDCLVQIFCDMLHVIAKKNECDCEKCQACEGGEDVTIEYAEGDTLSPILNTYFNNLLAAGFKQQLGFMSLCDFAPEIWGVVV